MKGYFQTNHGHEKRSEQPYFLSLKMFPDGICTDLVAMEYHHGGELFVMTEESVEQTRQKLVKWAREVKINKY
ncbi:hypothetical protein Dtox_2454 [Desulfofarcimen acetoxidans DSM 771]|uniref:Uncharacterized protein n=1 Tax=Desulfofarcimen acetoxidans (strain ATCC 49208 / DSM 771 / KCTC 5769 / VKM B-1644 / 5575) TaxID=485916 RepID=C8W0K8_DESAS|nr:hypothetical protein [Desulfofarcimen acetoxidans]ACV63263.1 hypothetical protein Dtox_2454 [Desulfofarcimen acetoxidans DSM 771]